MALGTTLPKTAMLSKKEAALPKALQILEISRTTRTALYNFSRLYSPSVTPGSLSLKK
jgi:hypothetical protein